MGRFAGTYAAVGVVGLVFAATGCAPRPTQRPEQDLTPFEQLLRKWTREYQFRRTVGGDDLVSSQASITERPSHQERLLLEATLFSDTVVHADLARLCQEDTSGAPCDTLVAHYRQKHDLPGTFRVEIYALATLSTPFQLKPLTIYLTDQDGIDYEPRRTDYGEPVTEERTYLDREVQRYDPYTASEYRVYRYRQGYEYQSTDHATLYFDRVNVIGKDLLGPGARLTMAFRAKRTQIGSVSWDLDKIRQGVDESRPSSRRWR